MADLLCHRSFFSCKGNTLNVCVNHHQQQQQQQHKRVAERHVLRGVTGVLLITVVLPTTVYVVCCTTVFIRTRQYIPTTDISLRSTSVYNHHV